MKPRHLLTILSLLLFSSCASIPQSTQKLTEKEVQKIMAPYIDDGLARALQGF